MLGLGSELNRRLVCCCGALLLSAVGCGGNEFIPVPGGSGAAAGAAGGGEDGGSSGASGQPGDGGGGGTSASGSGGSGGSTTASCNCKAGEYCREGSTDCFACTELSRLRFSTPERLSTLSDSAQDARFPRIGRTATDLLYFFEGVGIRYTTDASTSAGGAIRTTVPEDAGPLLLAAGLTSGQVAGVNFLFDRREEQRRIYFGRWTSVLELAELAPAPFNGEGNDHSIAMATAPGGGATPRGFWMTDRGLLGQALVTALASDASPTPVALQLGSPACALGPTGVALADEELSPWVTPDGKTLLVSHTGLDESCAVGDRGKDLYTAPLQPDTGQPTLPAVLVNDVNSDRDDVDPSFSADMCDLYFASNRDGGSFALYRARRR